MTGITAMATFRTTPREFYFTWRHVVLLATFALVYLAVRGRGLWPLRTPVRPMRTTTTVIIATMIGLTLWFFAFRRSRSGIDWSTTWCRRG